MTFRVQYVNAIMFAKISVRDNCPGWPFLVAALMLAPNVCCVNWSVSCLAAASTHQYFFVMTFLVSLQFAAILHSPFHYHSGLPIWLFWSHDLKFWLSFDKKQTKSGLLLSERVEADKALCERHIDIDIHYLQYVQISCEERVCTTMHGWCIAGLVQRAQ